MSFGDVIFKRYIVDGLAEADADIVIAVDTNWQDSVNRGRAADYVSCSEPNSRQAFYREIWLEHAGETLAEDQIHGEWMGVARIASAALPKVARARGRDGGRSGESAGEAASSVRRTRARGGRVRVIYTTGHWLDVDSLDDVLAAGEFQ